MTQHCKARSADGVSDHIATLCTLFLRTYVPGGRWGPSSRQQTCAQCRHCQFMLERTFSAHNIWNASEYIQFTELCYCLNVHTKHKKQLNINCGAPIRMALCTVRLTRCAISHNTTTHTQLVHRTNTMTDHTVPVSHIRHITNPSTHCSLLLQLLPIHHFVSPPFWAFKINCLTFWSQQSTCFAEHMKGRQLVLEMVLYCCITDVCSWTHSTHNNYCCAQLNTQYAP
jgi:hypothetical protein